jgi:hypothetical protein
MKTKHNAENLKDEEHRSHQKLRIDLGIQEE